MSFKKPSLKALLKFLKKFNKFGIIEKPWPGAILKWKIFQKKELKLKKEDEYF